MKKLIVLVGALGLFGLTSVNASAASLGSLRDTIGVGNTLSVGLNDNPSGQWYVANSNSAVVLSSVSQNQLIVKGLSVGSATINVCSQPQGGDCLTVNIIVQGVLGSFISSLHPTGTWVISGKTVFYVHANGLIPVSTPEIFYSNGGEFSQVVQITEADFYLPLLPLMVMNDSRLN